MRIIAGKYKGRQLIPPPTILTRPTSDRVRESIFNIISSLDRNILTGALVLDAFAGTGALGLEALSRGAEHVTFIEKNPQATQTIQKNITNLDCQPQTSIIMGDATKPPKASSPMNLVFLDPPYDQNLAELCINALIKQEWINSETLIILETAAKTALTLPPNTPLINQRRYGTTLISFISLHDVQGLDVR